MCDTIPTEIISLKKVGSSSSLNGSNKGEMILYIQFK